MPKTIVSAAGEAMPAAKNVTTLCADLDAILDRGVESPIVERAISGARAALGAHPMPAVKVNRRLALLGGITAAAAFCAKPADAGEHHDAELLHLDKEMEAVHARMESVAKVCKEICDRTGGNICPESEAAEEAFSAICDEQWEIGRRIFAIPANTVEGMAVKLRAGDRLLLGDFLDREDFLSIANDIRRLAGESAA